MLQFKNVVVFSYFVVLVVPHRNLPTRQFVVSAQRKRERTCIFARRRVTHTHTSPDKEPEYTHTCRGKSECFFAHVNQQTTISICLVFIFLSYFQRRRRAKALQSVDSRTLHTHSSEDFNAYSSPSPSAYSLPVLMAHASCGVDCTRRCERSTGKIT